MSSSQVANGSVPSSLENAVIGHPGVAEAAVIGVPHPKWDERPLLIVVRKSGAEVSGAELLAFLADKVAKWWLPDDVVFVEALPHTATGKLLKTQLRDQSAATSCQACGPAAEARPRAWPDPAPPECADLVH